MKNINPKFEIFVCICLIIFSLIIIYFSFDIPISEYEPLGSAALPRALSVIMIVLSLVTILRLLSRLDYQNKQKKEKLNIPIGYIKAFLIFICTIVFILILENQLFHFIPTSTLFLFIISCIMEYNKKKLLKYTIFSLMLSAFIFYVFTKFFYVDLA